MKSDREKWDSRYGGEGDSLPPPDAYLVEHAGLLTSGTALDLACGLGANAVFLAHRGYRVDAVDISFVALSRLQALADRLDLHIRTVAADLDSFPLPKAMYDLVIVFYFFAPALMPSIRDCLKQRGLLIYATYNERHRSVKPGFCRDYLVPPDGLAPYFADFDVLAHEESAGEAGNISRLVARKREP